MSDIKRRLLWESVKSSTKSGARKGGVYVTDAIDTIVTVLMMAIQIPVAIAVVLTTLALRLIGGIIGFILGCFVLNPIAGMKIGDFIGARVALGLQAVVQVILIGVVAILQLPIIAAELLLVTLPSAIIGGFFGLFATMFGAYPNKSEKVLRDVTLEEKIQTELAMKTLDSLKSLDSRTIQLIGTLYGHANKHDIKTVSGSLLKWISAKAESSSATEDYTVNRVQAALNSLVKKLTIRIDTVLKAVGLRKTSKWEKFAKKAAGSEEQVAYLKKYLSNDLNRGKHFYNVAIQALAKEGSRPVDDNGEIAPIVPIAPITSGPSSAQKIAIALDTKGLEKHVLVVDLPVFKFEPIDVTRLMTVQPMNTQAINMDAFKGRYFTEVLEKEETRDTPIYSPKGFFK